MSKILKVKWADKESEIDVEKLTFAEARAVEKVTGQPFADALQSKSMVSVQALVWVALKRHNPGILFSDLDDAAIGDVEMDWEKEEGEPDPTAPAEP